MLEKERLMVMGINIYHEIERLLQFGLKKNLIRLEDKDFTRNTVLEILELDDWQDVSVEEESLESPVSILERILDWAAVNGRLKEDTVTYRDLLDTKIIGRFIPRPSEVIREFTSLYETQGPKSATKYLYELSQQGHYIRTDRIEKNEHWYAPTEYGELEITINLSKPEKDPKAIAAAKSMKESTYPKCLLCKENVGYAGRVNHPARQNLRTMPFNLGGETWFLQYSPYVYYNEHAIVFLEEHNPMIISKRTFDRTLEFVEQLPHYFVGSNADLPIVGGSILSHDHYQGGHHDFPMAIAEIETEFKFEQYPKIKAGIVKWPMSVIRLQGMDRHSLAELSDKILQAWRKYSDESVGIYAFSEDTPHNTITPIARRRGELFEIDLVLRNNRTSEEHPLGIFHPHNEVHHIKKENIGLIEVMGLAVLPGRLQEELKLLAQSLVKDNFNEEITADERIAKHGPWALEIKEKHPDLNP
jgi:UDPglucose--hexose-1-phosphate uridylyltransferase